MNEQLRALLADYRNAEEFYRQCYEEGIRAIETGAMRDAVTWRDQSAIELRAALIANPQWIAERQEFEE